MAGHVFISHGSENRDEANELCAFIEGHGVKAWIAPRDVRPGIDYSEALQSAIETCIACVVLVTEMANKSPYVRAETEMAFSNSKPIFPVRLADIKPAPGLAFFLKIRHWTDAFGKEREASLDRLALELRTLSHVEPAAPAPEPPPPEPPPMAPTPDLAKAPAPAPPGPPPPPDAPGDAEKLAALGASGGVSKRAMIVAAGIAALAAIVIVIVMRQGQSRAVSDDPFFRGATSGPGTPQSMESGGQSQEPALPGGTTGAESKASVPTLDDANANALAEIRNLLEESGAQLEQLQEAPQPAPYE
jgi:hypothetical protein